MTVTAPSGKGCVVVGAQIETKLLAATTESLGSFQLKFTPASGEVLAAFNMTGCSITSLNHEYTAKGSVIAATNGATATMTHSGTTGQKTLTLSGQNAGIDSALTFEANVDTALALT